MWLHLLLPFIYSSVFILRFGQHPLDFLQLLLGIVMGFCLILLDRLLHALYIDPETEFSKKVQVAWQKKQFMTVFHSIWKESIFEQTHLISSSTIFMVSYMAIAVYV